MILLRKLILAGAALGFGAQQSMAQSQDVDVRPSNGAPTAGTGLWTRYHLGQTNDDFVRFQGARSVAPSLRGSSGLPGLAVRYRLGLGENPEFSRPVVASGESKAADVSAYLTVSSKGEPALRSKLILRESQGGIAGRNTLEYSIEPDGRWTERNVVTGSSTPPNPPALGLARTRKGTLSGEELTKLATALANANFNTLPATIGTAQPVNPHQYEISFGERTIKIEGVPPRRGGQIGTDFEVATEIDASTRTRLSGLARAISAAIPTSP